MKELTRTTPRYGQRQTETEKMMMGQTRKTNEVYDSTTLHTAHTWEKKILLESLKARELVRERERELLVKDD